MFLRILYGMLFVLTCVVGWQAYALYQARTSAPDVPPAMTIGPEEATLQAVLFYDYQCPYCKDIYPAVLEALEADGNVRLALRPVPALGEESDRLVRLVHAAHAQDRFAALHSALINHYGPVTPERLREIAARNDMDAERLLRDSTAQEARDFSAENYTIASRLGINATPTILAGDLAYTPGDSMPDAEELRAFFAQARGESSAGSNDVAPAVRD